MLFILFGSTAEVGNKSRRFFEKQGFEIIKKLNYVPEDSVLRTYYEPRKLATLEEVKACDFTYSNNGGMVIGFNEKQILDAVQGKKNCLITLSPTTIEFIREIKVAYGDYVTVIASYTEEPQLLKLFSALPNITQREIDLRMATGRKVKQIIINERQLFDEIAIYGGEDSPFNYEALYKQYQLAIDRAAEKQLKQNEHTVDMPYTGDEKYIFISYSHADKDTVESILHKLQQSGYRIWYDKGIKGGKNWIKIVSPKIDSLSCEYVLLFFSENAEKSDNVFDEICAARDNKKEIITIKLDDHKMNTDIKIATHHGLYIEYRKEDFEEELKNSLNNSVKVK